MLKLNPEERLFIDGALVASEDGQAYKLINPGSQEVAGVVTAASLADADRALAAARRCFDQTDWPTNRTRRLDARRRLPCRHECRTDDGHQGGPARAVALATV